MNDSSLELEMTAAPKNTSGEYHSISITDDVLGKNKPSEASLSKSSEDPITKHRLTTFLKVIISAILFGGWIYLYLMSLYSCQKSQAECLQSLTQELAVLIGFEVFASAFLFNVMIILTYKQIVNKVFTILSVPIMIYLFYFYDTGTDLSSHGAYNRAFFYFFSILIIIFLCFMYGLLKSLIIHPIKTVLLIIFLVLLIYFSVKEKIKNSCELWSKGFKQTTIKKSGGCILPEPNTCFLYYTNNIFDISRIKGINCKNERSDEEYDLLKWSNKTDVKRIGFPRTEKWPFFPDSILKNWNFNIFNNMIDVDKEPEKAKDVEVIIDYNDKFPSVDINVKTDEDLIKQREKLYEENKNNTLIKNVLFIYIDSFSRNSFRRKFTKTFEWLEDKYKNPNSDFSSYQFLKYHSLTYYTYANMIPGYFGVHSFKKHGDYFLYDVKNAGYITGQSYDVCERETWDLEMAFKPWLNYTNFDHEFNGFYCDPVYSDPEKPYGPLKGAYSIVRRCMYGKDAGEWQIEYAKKFFEAYKDQPKFFRLAFLDAHEGTGEVIKYMDDPIMDLIDFLHKNGHLKDTLIKFQADHGMSMPGPTYIIKPIDYYYEVFLPSLFYVIPKDNENYDIINENLRANENQMVTPFDTHSGLLSIFNKNKNTTEYGQSLFYNKVNDTNRGCEYFQIEDKYCMCGYGLPKLK